MNDVALDGAVVIALDGGGTKTDAAALTIDGELVEYRRGPSSSPHLDGNEHSYATVDRMVREVAGTNRVAHAGLYLSGVDLPVEFDAYARRVADFDWASSTTIDNDLVALLRAGTDEPDAVAVVCGTGVNAIGIAAGGAEARFPSLGAISGDWGGGCGLGAEALWHAARAIDGRGPATTLVDGIIELHGAASLSHFIEDLHFGRRGTADLAKLAPVVFDASQAGDPIARTLVDRQADELVAFARAALARLDLLERSVPVVLGGGIARAGDERLFSGIRSGLAEAAPNARIEILDCAPIVGAALLALSEAGASSSALQRARDEVSAATGSAAIH